jgi:hypothetical protein
MQLLVEQLLRGARVDTTGRSLLKLFPEPLPVCTEIPDRLTVLQAQIAIHDQLQCFSHNEIRRSKYPPAKWADGHIVPRFRGYRNITGLPLVQADVPPAVAGVA